MRYIVLLSVLVTVWCAPVADQDESLDRVKRAKEVMMFHNEGDEGSEKTKRSDTDFPAEENIDKNGLVMAKEPVDISDEQAEEMVPEDVSAETSDEVASSETAELPESPVISDEEGEDVPATDGELEENEEEDEDMVPGDSEENNYLDALKELAMIPSDQPNEDTSYRDFLLNYPYNPYAAPFRGYRYKRSQTRERGDILSPRLRVLKRNRRFKRDLLYPSDYLNDNYYPYEDNYVNMPYETYPEEPSDDDLTYLLDLIDEARGGEDNELDEPFVNSPYESYDPYDEVENYYPEPDNVPTYMLPKRQSGLTFVPGLKRRDFYPAFNEPGTHYAAFVPQKRMAEDYADAYQRVMGLAAALRREGGYPEEELEGYYRRK